MTDVIALPADPSADIDVHTAAALSDAGLVDLLDVRERDEWAAGHSAGATLIPLGELCGTLVGLAGPIVAVCRSGNRSGIAAGLLRARGLRVHNMASGMIAWTVADLPQVTGSN